jgi:hypothetical protein
MTRTPAVEERVQLTVTTLVLFQNPTRSSDAFQSGRVQVGCAGGLWLHADFGFLNQDDVTSVRGRAGRVMSLLPFSPIDQLQFIFSFVDLCATSPMAETRDSFTRPPG